MIKFLNIKNLFKIRNWKFEIYNFIKRLPLKIKGKLAY